MKKRKPLLEITHDGKLIINGDLIVNGNMGFGGKPPEITMGRKRKKAKK